MTEKSPQELPLSLVHHALLGSAIPALVHRANNCLSVIEGMLDLLQEIEPEEKQLAQEQSAILGELLKHLAQHARHELEEVGEIEVSHLLSEVGFALGEIGRFRRCDVERHTNMRAASIPGDRARLYRLLVSLGTERIGAIHQLGTVGSTLRLSFVVRGDRGRFLFVDGAGEVPCKPAYWEAFVTEVEGLGQLFGYALDRRRIGNAHALRISVPLVRATEWDAGEAPSRSSRRSDRILLVQPTGEEAELNVTLLSERGYQVEHRECCDDDAERFDLVLCDDELFPSLPRVQPPVLVLGAAYTDPHVLGAVQKPIKPQELLDRVGAALL